MKTKIEIIDETVKEYSDPGNRAKWGDDSYYAFRSLDGSGRVLTDPVGRCMLPEKLNLLYEVNNLPLDELYRVEEGASLDDFLKPEYRGHSIGFWNDLLVLHNNEWCWGSGGLTEFGRQSVTGLKNRYAPSLLVRFKRILRALLRRK